MVQIANGVEYQLEIIELDSLILDLNIEFPNFQIVPKQPSEVRRINTSEKSIEILPEIYTRDSYYSAPLVSLNPEGKLRGLSLGNILISPFKYNPVQNKLVIYYNIKFKLIPERAVSAVKTELYSPIFERALKDVVLNEGVSQQKKVISENPITLVILTDTLFRESIQAFVRWKTEKGFRVIEAYTSDPSVGNNRTDIANYLGELYANPPAGISPPSYLLIIGETDFVPLSSNSGVTDLYYTTYDGPDDYLPELFHGRISVKNCEELDIVLNKTMQYEKYQLRDPSYLDKSILIAGNDNSYATSHGNGQINYASSNYFNEDHQIDAMVFLHPEASSSDLEIRDLINVGAGFVNYTGHGDEGGWIDPAFRSNHLASFTENEKYNLSISNGCRTNVFSGDGDCFAEVLLKANKKGAIGYIGCTADSYWDEDFYWSVGVGPISSNPSFENTTLGFYDKAFHDTIQSTEFWATSLGEMIFAGNMAVQESNSGYREYYWKIYQLMGDPSLVPWFSVPDNPNVTYPLTLAPDAASILIEAEKNDYAAISVNGVLLDAKHADEFGQAELSIPVEYRGDTLLLVVTGDRRQPFVRQIPDQGYFEMIDIHVMSESIHDDGILSNGEEASFSITLVNNSIGASSAGELVVESMGKNMTILEDHTALPSVAPKDTIILNNAFPFLVTDSLVDLSKVQLFFSRTADKTYNSFYHSLQLHSSNLYVSSFSVSDDSGGNGNGILEPGEEIQLTLEIENKGSFKSDSIRLEISDLEEAFTKRQILNAMSLESGEVKSYESTVIIPESFEDVGFKIIPLLLGDGHFTHDTLYLFVGKYVEDFSNDTLKGDLWKRMDWHRDTAEYLSGPASLKSADITHGESSIFSTSVHVFEPDSITFSYKVSSELKYDLLKFMVDGTEIESWSGIQDWSKFSCMLDVGMHELQWIYEKDINTDGGEDAAWVDDIIFVEDAFIPYDLSMDSIIVKRIGSFLEEESISLVISNVGLDTIFNFSLAYRLNETEWNEFSFTNMILPDSSSIITLPEYIDVSDVGVYDLDVIIKSLPDNFPWNDSLSASIEHYEFPDISISHLDYDSSNYNYVNLIALLKNSGNITVEDLFYEVTIEEEFMNRGKASINLAPGDSIETPINLINEYYSWLETGWYDYRVEIEEDSLLSNNTVAGTVFWIATSDIVEKAYRMKLYPNPVRDIFMLQLDAGIELPVQVNFLTMKGKLLHTMIIDSQEITFFAEEIFDSGGMYFIQILDKNGTHLSTKKISFIRKK
jgi:hypothetical protein